MFCCNLVCLICSIDVCARHYTIKRVPLLAPEKWREGPCLAARGPVLCLVSLQVFVSMIACLLPHCMCECVLICCMHAAAGS
jgi:hypothetical protein